MSRPPAVPCRGKNACAGYMRGDARAAAPAGARRRDRGARTEGAGERARDCSRLGRQRTSNMPTISVTLEVSQLSGWLKACALCRGSQAQGTRCGASRGPGGGRRHAIPGRARGVPGKGHETADWVTGRAEGEQRTANMELMSLTPEVSQFSIWLKADACCRGSQAGPTVRGGLRAGRGDRRRANAECACSVQGRARDCRLWWAGAGAGSSARETCVSCP